MAFGSRGHSMGGRPSGGSSFRGSAGGRTAFRGTPGGLGGTRISKPVNFMPSASAFGAPIAPPPINFGGGRHHGGGGLVSSLLGSAVSAGVGVASAAIVNKMHENSQLKLQEQQAQQQAEYARQQAEQQAELARQQAEVQLEIERLKAKQEETKRDAIQDLRYYANCPYCLGVNNGAKFCQYCGSSLAYYDEEDDDMKNDKKTEGGNAKAQ